jgi:hypothetical protein
MARQVLQQTVVTDSGDVIANAEVTIRKESDNSLVDVYLVESGGTPTTNPFFTDVEGFFRVYVEAPEKVYLTATGTGGNVEFRDIQLAGTSVQYDAATSGTPTSGLVDAALGFYGVGGLATTVSDANAVLKTGFYSGAGAGGVNFPPNMNYGVLLNAVRQSNSAVNGRLYIGDVSGVARAFIGVSSNSGATWDNQELYHTGSLNVNEFGGLAAGDLLAYGVATGATTAIVYLPLNSKTAPLSATLTGTLELRKADGVVLASGISSLVPLGSLTSNRNYAFLFSGLSGLTPNVTSVQLRTESVSSKITVNF